MVQKYLDLYFVVQYCITILCLCDRCFSQSQCHDFIRGLGGGDGGRQGGVMGGSVLHDGSAHHVEAAEGPQEGEQLPVADSAGGGEADPGAVAGVHHVEVEDDDAGAGADHLLGLLGRLDRPEGHKLVHSDCTVALQVTGGLQLGALSDSPNSNVNGPGVQIDQN